MSYTDLLQPLAHHVDFITACLNLAVVLAAYGCDCEPVETPLFWSDPVHRAWLIAMHQEPGGFLLH